MNTRIMWKLIPAVVACCVVGLASAKLPAPPPADPVKAEEAKKKAAEGAKKEAEQLDKARDRAVENYRKHKGLATTAAKKK